MGLSSGLAKTFIGSIINEDDNLVIRAWIGLVKEAIYAASRSKWMRTPQTAPESSAKTFDGVTTLFINSNSVMELDSWEFSIVVRARAPRSPPSSIPHFSFMSNTSEKKRPLYD